MKLDLKSIPTQLQKTLKKLQGYSVFIFIIFILLIFSFLVFRINVLARSEPSEDAVDAKLESVKRPKIDQASIDKLQQLQDNSVQVQTLFQQARNNPFNE